jgi:hypothetical protein
VRFASPVLTGVVQPLRRMSERRTAILVREEKQATETFFGLKNRYDQSIEIAPAPVRREKLPPSPRQGNTRQKCIIAT